MTGRRYIEAVKQLEADKKPHGMQLMEHPEVVALFDDAEVMAAVQEIGRDHTAFKKYQNNERVMRMYRFMAAQAAQRMQTLAEQGQR